MRKSKKINLLSLAKFQAFLFMLIGLVAGILYSFGGLIVDTLVTLGLVTTTETPGLGYGTVLALGAFIGMPLIAMAVGFVTGFIEALLYNIFTKWFGEIDIDLKK